MTIRIDYWLHYDYDVNENGFMASEKIEKRGLSLDELKQVCRRIMWQLEDTLNPEDLKYAVEVVAYADQMFNEPMTIHWDCRGCDVKRELYKGG